MNSKELQEYCEQFGDVVREAREAAKLTQKELSDRCDFPVRFVEMVEVGKISPSYFARTKMSKALGVDVEKDSTRIAESLKIT